MGRRRRAGRLRGIGAGDVAGPEGPTAVEPRESSLPAAPPPTLREAVALAEDALERAGVGEAVADARLLLASVLGASPTWVFTHEKDALAREAWEAYRLAVDRRASREPLQHLLGIQEFWTLRLAVSSEALIPRPETEVLVEASLAALRGVRAPRIADVGTGSGALAVALATEIPTARLVATDVSEAALEVARRNVRELGVADRVELRLGSLAEPLADGAFDAIVANLPYVTEDEWEGLEPEVRDHEPRLALVGGADGLDVIRELVREARAVLRPGGWMGLEVGWKQAGEVRGLLAAGGWRDVETRKDLAGIERVVSARRG